MDDQYYSASYFKIILTGILLITIMPGDVVATFTIGNILNESSASIIHAIPFFFSMALLCSVPLFNYLLMGKRGPNILNNLNNWLNKHDYIINISVLVIFIILMFA